MHALLWLEDANGSVAPTFWSKENNEDSAEDESGELLRQRKEEVERFADMMVTTNPLEIRCDNHKHMRDFPEDCELHKV